MKTLILIVKEVLQVTINIRIVFKIVKEVLNNYKFKSESFIAVRLNFFLIVELLNKLYNNTLFS